MTPKITYTSADVDLEAFHRDFDVALERVHGSAGAQYPNWIGGVAERIRARRFDLAALMSLEVGKSRLEAMGDAEESADLIEYYCAQMEDANGFVRQMRRVTAIEHNTDVQRPYGVFACIAPFNFPLALSTGMSTAALIAGNAVVYKPSEDAPWTGLELYHLYRDAGLPPGRVQLRRISTRPPKESCARRSDSRIRNAAPRRACTCTAPWRPRSWNGCWSGPKPWRSAIPRSAMSISGR